MPDTHNDPYQAETALVRSLDLFHFRATWRNYETSQTVGSHRHQPCDLVSARQANGKSGAHIIARAARRALIGLAASQPDGALTCPHPAPDLGTGLRSSDSNRVPARVMDRRRVARRRLAADAPATAIVVRHRSIGHRAPVLRWALDARRAAMTQSITNPRVTLRFQNSYENQP